MTKLDKLKTRLLQKPKDFTYEELSSLLQKLGYEELKLGKTAGSRVAFCHSVTSHIIRLHRPHPSNIIKSYLFRKLIEELEKEGLL
jgi:hypothetical protein